RGFVEHLRTMATASAVADRIHILPPALPSDLERLATAYDVGLVGETGYSSNRRIALTNKLFIYLLAGVPVVMSDIPAHKEFASEAGIASQLYAADDADSLATVLDTLLGDPKMLAARRAAAFRLGQTRFNWETEQLTLLNCIRTAFGANKADPACVTIAS